MFRKNHTKTIDSILERINELEMKRACIDIELAELAGFLKDKEFVIGAKMNDLKNAGITPWSAVYEDIFA